MVIAVKFYVYLFYKFVSVSDTANLDAEIEKPTEQNSDSQEAMLGISP